MSINEAMVIDMNEAQVRTLEQVRLVVAGTQALEFRRAEDASLAEHRLVGSPVAFGRVGPLASCCTSVHATRGGRHRSA